MKNKRKNSGFTLIELVVVVAIIGVLASVITPRVRTALMKAKDAKAVGTLDALRTASNVYYAEKGIAPFIIVAGDNTALADLTDTSASPLTVGHLALLVKNGYLDRSSAIKFLPSTVPTSTFDTLVANGTAARNDAVIASLPVTIQVGNTSVAGSGSAPPTIKASGDCSSIGVPAANPSYTPGFVTFGWEKDGIGIKVLKTTSLDSAGAVVPADTDANTSCELWAGK